MAAEYKLTLPDEATLIAELEKTHREFARRHKGPKQLTPADAKRKSASKSKMAVKKGKGPRKES
jgi:hypothetical protein